MIKKGLLLILFLSVTIASSFSTVYYVATTGNDSNNGSKEQPFATIQRVQDAVNPGDTVYVRGGTYRMNESQIAKKVRMWAYVTYLDKSGLPGKRINYWAYPGEKPLFNYTDIKPEGLRVTAFQVMGSWIYFKGLEVVGVQVTIKTHTQSECFENNGSNNIFELLSMHDGQAIGIYCLNGSNNLFLNCDAFRNWDYTSENGKGGNTDGFGCHPRKGSVNNVFRGCRSWFNSDDGYDCINSAESVTFENCWSFYNGYSSSFASLGDGNGFKAGGYGKTPVDKLPDPIPGHVVRFCLAVHNKANGFYSNHHLTGSTWINNTSYENRTNYNMTNRLPDNVTDVDGYGHKMRNNLGYKGGMEIMRIDKAKCDLSHNYFDMNVNVSDDDFLSLDKSLLTAPRQADGSLPDIPFMKLRPGSNLIDKGVDAGFPFNGKAPDLGAFETPAK
ncbi:MAG TPA: right-handed parallel beta-helix repeat-containing protein [Bacteroidales bacterium]